MAANTITPLFTAIANATGGRNGHSETTDGSVSVNLSVPKEMGGPGLPGTTTPEHLFSTGYAACFRGAMDVIAGQMKRSVRDANVRCETSIGPREAGGFGIAVKMHVTVPTLSTAEATEVVEATHANICPYSHATRGNIDIEFVVTGND